MILSYLYLNPDHPQAERERRDLCAMHQRVIDATIGMDETGPRRLWAQPGKHLLVIRANEPVTPARLPADYTQRIIHQPWQPPPDGHVRAALIVNPTSRRQGGRTTQVIADPAEQQRWLRARLDGILHVDTLHITDNRVRTGQHRSGHRIVYRLVNAHLTGKVIDHDRLVQFARDGLGRARAYGGGLSIWQAAR